MFCDTHISGFWAICFLETNNRFYNSIPCRSQNVFVAVKRFMLYVFLEHALRVLGLTRFCIHIYFLVFVKNVLVKYLIFLVFLKTFWTKYKFPLFL